MMYNLMSTASSF